MKIIIFDFEVYKYDTLLGTILLDIDTNEEIIKLMWNEDEIRKFYLEHDNDIWVGHNSTYYDNLILEAIVDNQSAYEMNNKIIKGGIRRKTKLHLYSYDLMSVSRTPFSLKLTELICGKNIHMTDVDFDTNRPLTNDEKKLTEKYNIDDLKQTLYNFKMFYNQFKLRLQIINKYNLDLAHNLQVTGTQLAANVLGAHNNPMLKYDRIEPKLYDTLELKNERLKEFYLNEEFRENKKDIIHVCDADLTIAAGGIHSAIPKFHADKILYADVSGYYNLVMMNLDLLPRTMPKESKELYEFMYHEQLRLKKFPELADERSMYKTILLSVFGAMNNEYTDFYDPWKALLVTISGQLFLVDLLEKLEGLVTVVQANTDGLMLIPFNWDDEPKIIKIIEDWEKRTGFVIKKEHLYNLWQRDVNCYICEDEHGGVIFKGDAVRNYLVDDVQYASCRLFDCKEPPIIAQGLVNYLLYGIEPETTVDDKKEDLKLFQYACKKGTFDYMTEDEYVIMRNNKGRQVEQLYHSHEVRPLNRVFAKKLELINGLKTFTILTKHKDNHGKHQKTKVPNLPDSVFIYNDDITNAYELLKDKIDYEYYVNRIYERISEFIQFDEEPKEKIKSKQKIDPYQLSFDL